MSSQYTHMARVSECDFQYIEQSNGGKVFSFTQNIKNGIHILPTTFQAPLKYFYTCTVYHVLMCVHKFHLIQVKCSNKNPIVTQNAFDLFRTLK